MEPHFCAAMLGAHLGDIDTVVKAAEHLLCTAVEAAGQADIEEVRERHATVYVHRLLQQLTVHASSRAVLQVSVCPVPCCLLPAA